MVRDATFSIARRASRGSRNGLLFAIFLLPLFMQSILGWPPTLAGLLVMPAPLVMAALMPLSGALSDKTGARALVLSGMAIAAIGAFLLVHIDTDWTLGRIAIANLVRTGALGLLFTPLTMAALTNVPRNRVGGASAILNTVWQVAAHVSARNDP